MLSPSALRNRKVVLFAAAMLVAGTSTSFAQGGGAGGAGGAAGGGGTGTGAGGARGGAAVPAVPPPAPSASPSVVNPSNPGTVPQQSSTPLNPSTPSTTPSTPSTTSSGGVTSPANEGVPSTTDRPERRSKARSVYHHRGRAAGAALGSYYCGPSPCFRIYPPTIYRYAALVPLLWRRSTGSRPCGGSAIMTMRPVNGGVGFPGMAAMGGVPDITATEGDDGCFVRGRWPSHRSLVSGIK
jgi:hypothetical protein